MEFSEVVSARRSVSKYESGLDISDRQLQTLFQQVVLSPSSFNLQHWRFVVIRDPARKAELRKAAFNQEQVEAASAAIVVIGKLNAHEDATRIFDETPKNVQESMIPMIEGSYAGKTAFQRDEAIRSASLAAMTLMLTATDMGFDTGPMIGFDPAAVSRLINLDDNHIPVMMIVIGKRTNEMRPRAFRLPPSDVVRLETLDGARLPQG